MTPKVVLIGPGASAAWGLTGSDQGTITDTDPVNNVFAWQFSSF